MITKTYRVTFKLVGEENLPDFGMGAGVLGYQEFSLMASDENQAESDLFLQAVLRKAEELQGNFVRGEVEEI